MMWEEGKQAIKMCGKTDGGGGFFLWFRKTKADTKDDRKKSQKEICGNL